MNNNQFKIIVHTAIMSNDQGMQNTCSRLTEAMAAAGYPCSQSRFENIDPTLLSYSESPEAAPCESDYQSPFTAKYPIHDVTKTILEELAQAALQSESPEVPLVQQQEFHIPQQTHFTTHHEQMKRLHLQYSYLQSSHGLMKLDGTGPHDVQTPSPKKVVFPGSRVIPTKRRRRDSSSSPHESESPAKRLTPAKRSSLLKSPFVRTKLFKESLGNPLPAKNTSPTKEYDHNFIQRGPDFDPFKEHPELQLMDTPLLPNAKYSTQTIVTEKGARFLQGWTQDGKDMLVPLILKSKGTQDLKNGKPATRVGQGSTWRRMPRPRRLNTNSEHTGDQDSWA